MDNFLNICSAAVDLSALTINLRDYMIIPKILFLCIEYFIRTYCILAFVKN